MILNITKQELQIFEVEVESENLDDIVFIFNSFYNTYYYLFIKAVFIVFLSKSFLLKYQ